jgi:hypothetical protein
VVQRAVPNQSLQPTPRRDVFLVAQCGVPWGWLYLRGAAEHGRSAREVGAVGVARRG